MWQYTDRHLPFWMGVLLLFLLGYLPAPAQAETLTGWFTFVVADYPPESGRAPEITYTLTEDSGERHELLIDIALMQPLGGPMALNRKRVTVMGEWEEGGPAATEKFRVSSIALAPSLSPASPGDTFALDVSPNAPPPPSALPSAGTGLRVAVLTILCRFGDATDVTPYPVSHYEELMSSSYPGLDHYWREVSDGNIHLTGNVVVGWYNLPQPQSYYEEAEGFNDFKAGNDCEAAAEADVSLLDFDVINYAFNQDYDEPPKGGGVMIRTSDGQIAFVGRTWLPAGVHEKQDVWAHEMGHALGLQHSSGPYGTPYDSHWDVMSRGGSCMFRDPQYGCVGVHTIAYHKDVLGWIPPTRKYVAAPNSTQTITLERLGQPGAEGYLMAQIPIGGSDTNFYTVEARRFAGYDDNIPDEAIVIHKVDTTRADRLAQVVDVDNDISPNDAGAMWRVGEVFTDVDNHLQISIDAAYATGYRVTINTNPDTITTDCSSSLSSTRRSFSASDGRGSVEVTIPNGCQWAIASNNPWIWFTSEAVGSSFSVHYRVERNSSPKARTGTLTIGGQTFTVVQEGSDGTLFQDDMESGINNNEWDPDWFIFGPWALTTTTARSGTHAWTDSPDGHYQNNLDFDAVTGAVISAIASREIDLTEFESATLTFWHRYDFGSGDEGNVAIAGTFAGGIETIRSFRGTQSTWQQVSLDLSPFVGERIIFGFIVQSDASGTADGWYIDDVAVVSSDSIFTTDSISPVTLENPRPGSFQSGVGVISGWACEAEEIVIELNGTPLQAAYGTVREDTRSVCGDADNGFSLLWNWNNLGPGEHTVRALMDGIEFAYITVRVTTFGEPFLRGVSGTFDLPDFPASGETTMVRWEEALQNFIITDGQPDTGGGHSGVAGVSAVLENPSLGSAQSGVGVISGWACEAEEIVIELNGTPLQAAYGTVREDTQSVCGDTNNGFSLLWNWNNLGPGEHRVRALMDGREFAHTTVRVTTFREPFLRGASGTFNLPNFPYSGRTTSVRWEEALQNFVIIP